MVRGLAGSSRGRPRAGRGAIGRREAIVWQRQKGVRPTGWRRGLANPVLAVLPLLWLRSFDAATLQLACACRQ